MAEWTILGSGPIAGALRDAARFIDAPVDRAVVADGDDIPPGAVATSGAVLNPSVAHVLSDLLAFRVLEDAMRMTHRGELGALYSVFGSCRMTRGTDSATVQQQALLPLLSYTLALRPEPVARVWAASTSLETQDDCLFVTLRFQDDVIVTLEALAVADSAAGTEILVEIIGSERVARCEPTRQAVSVEPVGRAPQLLPWWEDGAERLLQVLAGPEPLLTDGAGLRAVWEAVLESARDGQPRFVS